MLLKNGICHKAIKVHTMHAASIKYNSNTPGNMQCCPSCTCTVEEEQHVLLEWPIYKDLKQKVNTVICSQGLQNIDRRI